MRILLSGANGFIGSALSTHLSRKGDVIFPLVRGPSSSGAVGWDPENGRAAKDDFEDFDAVIHLAGESIFGRWNEAKQKRILYSRTVGTFFLSTILSSLRRPPAIFISASAIGFYGDRGEKVLTEQSEPGKGFLAHVCTEWEKASASIEARGSRRVHTRFGVVIGPKGILQQLLLPYRLGLGGKIGSGRQWMSWISLDDLVRGIEFILDRDELEGPINLCSPHPVRQEQFAKTLASLLHRPAFLAQPAWLLRLVFGKLADEVLLASTRAEPRKLAQAGFSFQFPKLEEALALALRKLS